MILRPATMTDARLLHAWRNDLLTRANSITTDEVPWDNHVRWLESSLADPCRDLWIAEVDGVPVGTVRADVEVGQVEVSWTVAPEHRRKGYGHDMLRLVNVPNQVARIKRENVASQKIAASAGFKMVEDGEIQEWVSSDHPRQRRPAARLR